MKVVHIHWGLNFGGIETMLVNIANAQVKLGADVYLIIVNDLKEQSLINALDKRVHFICLNRKVGSKNPLFILKLRRLLKKIGPDAIHLQHSEFYAILPKNMKIIASATVHDIAGGRIRRKGMLPKIFPILNFYKKDNSNVVCIDEIPRVFAISKAVQKSILDKYGIKSIVVENGIRTELFQHRSNRFPEEDKPFKVVCVSRLDHEKKGQDLLIKAASMLNHKATITLIGDGASMDYLKNLDMQMGGGNRISRKENANIYRTAS